MYSEKDITVVRDLCKKYMEIAESDRHVKMRQRFLDTNNLKVVRPPLLIDEIPWQQMNYEHSLDCVCENAELRGMEYGLRAALFREKYFKCDNFIEPCWVVRKAFSSTGNGLDCLAYMIYVFFVLFGISRNFWQMKVFKRGFVLQHVNILVRFYVRVKRVFHVFFSETVKSVSC